MRQLWIENTTEDFEGLDPEKAIAVLPVAAIEQHGPHLPVATDTAIAQGNIARVLDLLPDDLEPVFLPVQQIGKSNEHLAFPGTLTFTSETLVRMWTEIGDSVARAGFRKMIIVNSHGGNVQAMEIVARELRVRHGMFVVASSWSRFGQPEGLYDADELRFGIHAGDMETSMMLYLTPDLVKMDKAENFVPASVEMESDYKRLRATGNVAAFGWMSQDLNEKGACGNAANATAEKGQKSNDFAARAFIELLEDVTRFPLSALGHSE
ncbi:MAG: creatininase family protein [Rhodobiaceae bacterium]|nr:creatininase family protein [Rhodobiaceae bacterium]